MALVGFVDRVVGPAAVVDADAFSASGGNALAGYSSVMGSDCFVFEFVFECVLAFKCVFECVLVCGSRSRYPLEITSAEQNPTTRFSTTYRKTIIF